jgi:hypothetical protein
LFFKKNQKNDCMFEPILIQRLQTARMSSSFEHQTQAQDGRDLDDGVTNGQDLELQEHAVAQEEELNLEELRTSRRTWNKAPRQTQWESHHRVQVYLEFLPGKEALT